MADEAGRPYDPAKDATAQEPLTANEQRLVTRLFGDPFSFPMEFKAWLRGWLEEQFPRLGTLAVAAETGAAGAFVPPAGAILDYGGDVAPGGYVMCNGAEYDKTSLVYQRLFNAIGYKFGTGSTGNMFRVPDLQGRIAVGRGALADVDTVGKSDGLALGTRRVKHGHEVVKFASQGVDPGTTVNVMIGTGFDQGAHDHGPTDGQPYPVGGPAFLVVNKIISLGS